MGHVTLEELPYPIVHYPGLYGTFITFSKTPSSDQTLCLCCKPLIENYLRLRKRTVVVRNANPLRMAPLDSYDFTEFIAKQSTEVEDPISILKFKPDLCHRCNLKAPSMRYCHEMYGGEFRQHYGWYIDQTYYRLGIDPHRFDFLDDVCPTEFLEELSTVGAMMRQDQAARRALALNNEPFRENEDLSRRRRAVNNKIESITRQEFGFRKVGDRWISETMLYQIVKAIFPEDEVLRHHRPKFLGGLELDIYVPSLRLAFEYQGQQHFHAIKAWGGEGALAKLKERDARKARMCRDQGITLLIVDYTDLITKAAIEGMISPASLSERNRTKAT